MEPIGFIGLGNMGRPLASNLCRKGAKVIVFDIVPNAANARGMAFADAPVGRLVSYAERGESPLPIATVAREAYSSARGQGHGAKDFSAMVDVLCDLVVAIERPRLTH